MAPFQSGGQENTSTKPHAKKHKQPKKQKLPNGYVRQDGPTSYFTKSPTGKKGKSKNPSKNSYSGIFVKSSKNPKIKPGDQILSIKDSAGQSFPMKSPPDFDNFLKSHPKPSRATIRIERDGKYHTLIVTRIANMIKI